MNKRAIYLFIGGFVLIHVLLVLSFWIIQKISPDDLTKQSLDFEKKEAYKYVFFGNSRVKKAVDFTQIEDAFDFTYATETSWNYYYRLKWLLENTPNIKIGTIVLPAETGQHIFADRNIYIDSPFWHNKVDYLEWIRLTGNWRKYFPHALKETIAPYCGLINHYTYSRRLELTWCEQRTAEELDKRLKTSYGMLSKGERLRLRKKNIRFTLKNISDLRLGGVYLSKIIELCQANQISCLFIKYPLTEGYQRELELELEKRNVSSVDSILTHFEVKVLDYSSLFHENENYFYDAHHINTFGNQQFTGILKRDLKQLNE